MTELLESYRYCNTVSSEVRVKGDDSYMLDPCLRFPSPAGEEELEMYGNFSNILYRGALGELVEPEMTAKFCGEAVISYCGDRDAWKSIRVPENERNLLFARPPVLSAARVRENWFSVSPSMAG